jgi:hypothetical protein
MGFLGIIKGVKIYLSITAAFKQPIIQSDFSNRFENRLEVIRYWLVKKVSGVRNNWVAGSSRLQA